MFLDKKYMTNCYENNNIKINAILKKNDIFLLLHDFAN